jgi:hypothetical protein
LEYWILNYATATTIPLFPLRVTVLLWHTFVCGIWNDNKAEMVGPEFRKAMRYVHRVPEKLTVEREGEMGNESEVIT